MRQLACLGLVVVGLFSVGSVGCSAPEDATASGSDDFTEGRSSISREINPTPIPTDTPIGRTMDGIQSELGRGLKELEPETRNGVTFRVFVDREGKEVFHRQTDPEGADIIRVGYRGPSDYDQIYADHPGKEPRDGKVDGFSQKTGRYSSVEDTNKDGKVDVYIAPATQGTDLAPFGDWVLPEGTMLANRILEDKNFDGFFELESLTARDGWFVH